MGICNKCNYFAYFDSGPEQRGYCFVCDYSEPRCRCKVVDEAVTLAHYALYGGPKPANIREEIRTEAARAYVNPDRLPDVLRRARRSL